MQANGTERHLKAAGEVRDHQAPVLNYREQDCTNVYKQLLLMACFDDKLRRLYTMSAALPCQRSPNTLQHYAKQCML
jgi:hypothetical protein